MFQNRGKKGYKSSPSGLARNVFQVAFIQSFYSLVIELHIPPEELVSLFFSTLFSRYHSPSI